MAFIYLDEEKERTVDAAETPAEPVATYEEPARPHVITISEGRKDWRLLILTKKA